MTDFLADTPSLGRVCCLGCEPDADPQAEILDVRICEAHRAAPGVDDERVNGGSALSGSGEAEASVCRAVQALIT